MYLKKNNTFPWICGVLASLCLALAAVLSGITGDQRVAETSRETTVVREESTVIEMGTETAMGGEPFLGTGQEGTSTERPFREDQLIESSVVREADTGEEQTYWPAEDLEEASPISVYAMWFFLLAGISLSCLFVLVMRQETAVLGPEIELGVLLIAIRWSVGLLFEGINLNPSVSAGLLWRIWYELVENYSYPVITLWPMIFLLLASLRGLFSWSGKRFPLTWSASHRLGMRVLGSSGRHGRYMLFQFLWCLLLTPASFLAATGPALFIEGLLPCLFGLSILLLSCACIVRMAAEADHLAEQIRLLHRGESVSPDGIWWKSEEETLADIRKQRDEAVRTAVTSERFKVELISNVSHDLRTPLTAILGYGELLEKEDLSQEGRKQLLQLNQKAGYMRDLVESLFELTKVSSGAVESKRESIDLIRLLEQTLGLFDDQLRGKELTVRRHYAREQLPLVTDGARMHQVFANLVGNAIKYALPGTRVHLEVTESEEECVIRMVNVAAYEMDFEPEEIVQRFARGDKARSTRGSGLGLAIAQTYTESVGGTFRVAIDGEQFSAIVSLPKQKS